MESASDRAERAVSRPLARAAIEAHTEWDAPHAFVTLHWDGANLTTPAYACIMAGIKPADYPKMMAGMALEELAKTPPTRRTRTCCKPSSSAWPNPARTRARKTASSTGGTGSGGHSTSVQTR